jgi:hypothetical protein
LRKLVRLADRIKNVGQDCGATGTLARQLVARRNIQV